jgi:hypothetical protein
MALYVVHAKTDMPLPGQGVPADSKTSDATAAEALPAASDISVKPQASTPRLQGALGEPARVTVVHSSPAPTAAAAASRAGAGPVAASAVAVAAPVGWQRNSSGTAEASAVLSSQQQQHNEQEVAVHMG